MPKVLFLGCNESQLPYLRAARSLGYTVVATDRNPAAPGAAAADSFHEVEYTDREGLIRIAKQEGFSGKDRVFSAATHLAYEGASAVAAACGIPFPSAESIDVCLDKSKFYALLRETGVPFPAFQLCTDGIVPELDPERVYYLKSDYGKSPSYCYRIEAGESPPALPTKFDAFYRKSFLLQQEIRGSEYRVNLYGDQAAVFLRLTERGWVPLPTLGPGHADVVSRLRKIVDALGLGDFLVKFDVIADPEGWYVLDLGLDRPLRMLLLFHHQGFDFEAEYTQAYLAGNVGLLPPWSELCTPVILVCDPTRSHAESLA